MAQLDKQTAARTFGLFIRRQREKLELKQRDVADMVGISQAYYCDIENGKRETGLSLSNNLCDALGTTLNAYIQFATMKKPQIPHLNETEKTPPV